MLQPVRRPRLLHAEHVQAAPGPLVPQQPQRHVHGRHGAEPHRQRVRPGPRRAAADFNGDGWIDLYVANDSQPNQLWINQHDGTFRNTALLAGAALTPEGKAEASMGVDAGDFDNDGDEDLFITEQTGEGHNLYVNDGTGAFDDQSARSGLAAASLGFTGFGTAWFDYDNDGWLDLLTVNGAVQTIQALADARDPFPLHQRKQLFRNLGNGRFEEVIGRGRRGVPALRSRPRRGVRRHRQRRRHRHRRLEQQRPGAVADQQRRQPEALARARGAA